MPDLICALQVSHTFAQTGEKLQGGHMRSCYFKNQFNNRGRVDVFSCLCMAVMICCLKEVEMKLQ